MALTRSGLATLSQVVSRLDFLDIVPFTLLIRHKLLPLHSLRKLSRQSAGSPPSPLGLPDFKARSPDAKLCDAYLVHPKRCSSPCAHPSPTLSSDAYILPPPFRIPVCEVGARHTRHKAMEGAGGHIAEKVQALSDIELALLLCLVADQHCIIETDEPLLDGLEHELRIVRCLFSNYSERTNFVRLLLMSLDLPAPCLNARKAQRWMILEIIFL